MSFARPPFARVVELVDTQVSEACASRCSGSSPLPGTTIRRVFPAGNEGNESGTGAGLKLAEALQIGARGGGSGDEPHICVQVQDRRLEPALPGVNRGEIEVRDVGRSRTAAPATVRCVIGRERIPIVGRGSAATLWGVRIPTARPGRGRR